MQDSLAIVSWNVTRQCNLRCKHCYLPARTQKPGNQELNTKEALRTIDEISLVNDETMLILSGVEPLLREDILQLASYASSKGMMVVMGSNGLLIDEKVASSLIRSGVAGISISLDSIEPGIHDEARSHEGAWQGAADAVRICKGEGLSVQVNAVVTGKNYGQIPALIEYAHSLGAKVFSPFFLVCTGNGEELTDITPVQYAEVLSLIAGSEGRYPGMIVRTRCAPTFRKVLYERDPGSMLLKMDTGRCLAGLRYCRISPEGDVTPCPYMPVSAGSIKDKAFGDIWKNSEVFASLRRGLPGGKCGRCEFRLICGGCRARAYARYQDYLSEDPWCDYSPEGRVVISPPIFEKKPQTAMNDTPLPLWTKEAEERLKRVPSFVRSMVKMAVEKYAAQSNLREITLEMMEELKQKAGMGGMGGHR